MLIKAHYEVEADIPENIKENYESRDGKYYLKVEGIKTQADIDAVKKALQSEREIKAELEKELKKFDGINADEVSKLQQELKELKIAGKGNNFQLDDQKINEIAESRAKQKIDIITREKENLQKQLESISKEHENLILEKKTNTINSELQKCANDIDGFRKTAIDDVLARAGMFELAEDGKVVTKQNCGIAPGMTAKDWLLETVKKQTHWVEGSNGAGAGKPGLEGGKPAITNPHTAMKELVADVFK